MEPLRVSRMGRGECRQHEFAPAVPAPRRFLARHLLSQHCPGAATAGLLRSRELGQPITPFVAAIAAFESTRSFATSRIWRRWKPSRTNLGSTFGKVRSLRLL